MLVDYHIHPNYSLDAEGSVDEYCRRALAIGLDEICFTTHYDINPVGRNGGVVARVKDKLVPMDSNWLEPYFEEIIRAKRAYSENGLRVKIGIEMNHYPDFEDEVTSSPY